VDKRRFLKLVDSVMFFNEVDLLKARCAEHYDHVEKIFIIESNKTHSNLDKPLYFKEHESEFIEWKDKIHHLICPNEKFIPCDWPHPQKSAHKNENIQRFFALESGLMKTYDWALIADCDEIIKKAEFKQLKEWLENSDKCINRIKFELYYYFLNVKFNSEWNVARLFNLSRSINDIMSVWCKGTLSDTYDRIVGQHFSYLGGANKIQEKLKAFMHHREVQAFHGLSHIQHAIDNMNDLFNRTSLGPLKVVENKNGLPKYMQSNWDIYSKYYKGK